MGSYLYFRERPRLTKHSVWLLLIALILLPGCPTQPTTSKPKIDVVSIEPGTAKPGHYVTVKTSVHDTSSDCDLVFSGTRMIPLAQTADSVTFMVPPVAPGVYVVAITPANTPVQGKSAQLTVESPAPITGAEAEHLYDTLTKLNDAARDYTLLCADRLGMKSDQSTVLTEGFANSERLLATATQHLNTLSGTELNALCMMISGSGIGEEASKALKSLEADPLFANHVLLAKAATPSLSDAEFFALMTKLDTLSAVFTDLSAIIEVAKLASFAAALTGLAPGIGLVTWANLTVMGGVIATTDAIIDGTFPTDLKSIRLEVKPDTGLALNPGEYATLIGYGTFGPQGKIESGLLNTTLRLAFDNRAKNVQSLLSKTLSTNPAMRDRLMAEARSALSDVLRVAGFDENDRLYPGDLLQMPWFSDIRISPAFYGISASDQFVSSSFGALTPLVGDKASKSLQKALLRLAGGTTAATGNVPVRVDDSNVVSYDPATGKLHAEYAGSTIVHTRPYTYGAKGQFLQLFPVEGWLYLEEGTTTKTAAGATIAVNTPCTVVVSAGSDPASQVIEDVPIIGVVPGVFDTDGGEFELTVSPVDSEGRLVYKDLTVDNFDFTTLWLYPVNEPNNKITDGFVTSKEIEIKLPQDTSGNVSIALLLDSTGSMAGHDPNRLRVTAAQGLIDKLKEGDLAAVMDFGAGYTAPYAYTRMLQPFTSNKTLLNSALDQVTEYGGTPLYSSLLETLSYIASQQVANPTIVVLSDGESNEGESDVNVVIQAAKQASVKVFGVGLGDGVDFTQLQALTSQTGGTFAFAQDATQLAQLYENVGIAASAGMVKVHAHGVFLPPLENPGRYQLTGTLITTYGGYTIHTPFEFTIDVVSFKQRLLIEQAAGIRP